MHSASVIIIAAIVISVYWILFTDTSFNFSSKLFLAKCHLLIIVLETCSSYLYFCKICAQSPSPFHSRALVSPCVGPSGLCLVNCFKQRETLKSLSRKIILLPFVYCRSFAPEGHSRRWGFGRRKARWHREKHRHNGEGVTGDGEMGFFWQQKRGVNMKGWRMVEKEGTTVGMAYRLSAPWNIHHVNRGPNNIRTVRRQPHTYTHTALFHCLQGCFTANALYFPSTAGKQWILCLINMYRLKNKHK